jgi:hypothetical protein
VGIPVRITKSCLVDVDVDTTGFLTIVAADMTSLQTVSARGLSRIVGRATDQFAIMADLIHPIRAHRRQSGTNNTGLIQNNAQPRRLASALYTSPAVYGVQYVCMYVCMHVYMHICHHMPDDPRMRHPDQSSQLKPASYLSMRL